MAYFANTNIPDTVLNALKAEDPGKYTRLVNGLKSAIANNDSRAANDAIYSIAMFTMQKGGEGKDKLEYGKEQGNPNVSKIHSGHWRVTSGIDNYMPWAAEHVNSSDSSYMQHDGRLVTYDDKMGAAIDGKIVDWGQPGHTEGGGKMDVENPHIGKDAAPPTNPKHTGGATNSDLAAIWPNVDWTGGQGDADVEQYPHWTIEDKGNVTPELPAQEQIDLLSYRPQSLDYWKEYVPTESRGLLEMTRKLQPEYSLAYQPGEFRDPAGWENWRAGETGHSGHIPEGAWRRATYNPATEANLKDESSGYTAAGHPVQNPWARDKTGAYTKIHAPGWGKWGVKETQTNPWDFTSPAMGTNIAWKDWDAKDLNVTGALNKNWEGLLKTMDTSPTISPGLLSVGKGGPISFDGKTAKKGSVFTVDN